MECLADRRYQFWWFANRQRSKVISKLGRIMQPKLLRCHKEGLLEPFIGHSDHFGWITISINHPVESILAQNDYQEQLMRSNGPISNVRPRIAWQTLHAWSQFCRLTLCTATALNWELRLNFFGERRFKLPNASHIISLRTSWDEMPSTFSANLRGSQKAQGGHSFLWANFLDFEVSCAYFFLLSIIFIWSYLYILRHLGDLFFLVKQSLR